jgi:hypothetical protein
MSNYTKATNFTAKDSLSTGDPGKLIKGSEIDAEYSAIATAITSKADTASPTFTGTPSAPTAASGTSSTQLATTAFVQAALAAAYPVGSIYTNATVSTNPATLLGFGTWAAFGAGRVAIGDDGSSFVAGATGGSADAIVVSHTHTASSSVTDPGHTHTHNLQIAYNNTSTPGGAAGAISSSTGTINSATTGITVATTVNSTGSSGTNANLQPYVVVYMWKRTA